MSRLRILSHSDINQGVLSIFSHMLLLQDREGGAMFNVGKQKIKGLSCEEKGMWTMDNGECTDDQSDDLGFYGLGEAGRRH